MSGGSVAGGGPLAGKRIVNTRAEHQAAHLTGLLEARGAQVLLYPTIAIVPPQDTAPLDRALRATVAGEYDWLILTSANTVQVLAQRLQLLGLSSVALSRVKTAAVGPATAQAAEEQLGVRAALVPEEYVAESLAAFLELSAGSRVLLPQSAIARPVLAESLQAAGAAVTAVAAYRTVVGHGGVELASLLHEGDIDAVIFTSASTVRNFVRRLEQEGGSPAMLAGVCIACIGPVTADAAKQCGLRVDVVPEEHTLEALVVELEKVFWYFGDQRLEK